MLNLDNLPKNGSVVTYKHRGATFQMTVTSSRIRYGQVDVCLVPLQGTGSFWVTADSVIPSATATIEAL